MNNEFLRPKITSEITIGISITITTSYSQVSFISSRASRVFQVSRSPSRPTISLSHEALWSARKKCEERWGGAFSRYGN